MELCDESLSSAQERQPNKCFSEEVVRKVCLDISRAIEFIHKKNIAYRDMKIENIMVKTLPNGLKTYKLSDFGTAKKNDTKDSSMKSFIGTAAFMAPETIDQEKSGYTSEVDCWGLGITAYNLLTGKFPYDVNSSEEAYASITNDSVQSYCLPKELNVSKECRNFVNLLLIKYSSINVCVCVCVYNLSKIFAFDFFRDPNLRLKTGLLLKNPFIKTYDLDMYNISSTYSPLPKFELTTIEIEQGEPMYKTWFELTQSSSSYVILNGQLAMGSTPFQRIVKDVMCFKYDKATLSRITGEVNTKELVNNMDLSIMYPSNIPDVPGETLDELVKRLNAPFYLVEYLISYMYKTQFVRSLLLTKRFIIYTLNYLKECTTKIVDAYNAVPSHSHCQVSVGAADTSSIFAISEPPESTKPYTTQYINMSKIKISSGKTTEAAEVSRFLKIFKGIFDKIIKLFEFKYVQSDFDNAKRLWNSLLTVLSCHDMLCELVSISNKREFTPSTIKALEDGVDFLSKNLPQELKITKVVLQNGSVPSNPPFFVDTSLSYPQPFQPPPFIPSQSVSSGGGNFGNDGSAPTYFNVTPGNTNTGNGDNVELPMNGCDGVDNYEVPMYENGEILMNGNFGNGNDGELSMDDSVRSCDVSMNGSKISMNGSVRNGDDVEFPIDDFQAIQSTPANSFNNACVANYGGSNSADMVGSHPPQGISREREAELLRRIRELEIENEKYKKICKDYFELVKYLTSEN